MRLETEGEREGQDVQPADVPEARGGGTGPPAGELEARGAEPLPGAPGAVGEAPSQPSESDPEPERAEPHNSVIYRLKQALSALLNLFSGAHVIVVVAFPGENQTVQISHISSVPVPITQELLRGVLNNLAPDHRKAPRRIRRMRRPS